MAFWSSESSGSSSMSSSRLISSPSSSSTLKGSFRAGAFLGDFPTSRDFEPREAGASDPSKSSSSEKKSSSSSSSSFSSSKSGSLPRPGSFALRCLPLCLVLSEPLKRSAPPPLLFLFWFEKPSSKSSSSSKLKSSKVDRLPRWSPRVGAPLDAEREDLSLSRLDEAPPSTSRSLNDVPRLSASSPNKSLIVNLFEPSPDSSPSPSSSSMS
mmetsp:Transcript_4113/g.12365  ORF Transcript_4113/g.12365 Transcript_4113/m.12365 type:complete len:211 (-) Transcript_4113:50-682(-)